MLLQPYQQNWEVDFQQIQQVLQEALEGVEITIHHVGSTAVENLAAKPIIDIDIAFSETVAFENIKQRLENLGYLHNGDQGIKDREAFKRQRTASHKILDHIQHHLYVCPSDSKELRRHLTLRDYLRTHEKERQQYEVLKYQIAAAALQDRKVYAILKEKQATTFIESILEKATKPYKGYTVYDEADFFEKYTQKRKKGNAPNELIEQPIIEELLGEMTGKQILDLGCGDGSYGKELLAKGAIYYVGIEGSKNMAQLARQQLQGYKAEIIQQDIEETELGEDLYDIVLSRLVLHYIADLSTLLKRVAACLRTNGQFIFSIEHPIITSCYDAYHTTTKRGSWVVDNYFSIGERVNTWIGKDVVKYHRTMEEYWRLLKNANFEVIEIRESQPIASNFEDKKEFERRNRIPLFILFKLRKK